MRKIGLATSALLWSLTMGCGDDIEEIAAQSVATLEPVRGTDARSRLVAGTEATASSLSRLRLDTGPVLLLDGARVTVADDGAVTLALDAEGKAFAEVLPGQALTLSVGEQQLVARDASFSIEGERVYVVRGELTATQGANRRRVAAGEELSFGSGSVAGARLWRDWTGGLAQPGPGLHEDAAIGTLEARVPDEVGQARWPLVMRRLDVHATVREDLAVTEVDQVFFNPASEAVEGYYHIRVPEGAVLQRFAVDRDGRMVDGYVREKAQAQQAYEAQVYRGSTLDPALLEWVAPGEYRARIYPIAPGAARRISIRYSEWLRRDDATGPRRYRFPMAGGADAPRIQELSFEADLADAKVARVRAGLGAQVEGTTVRLRESDFRPRVDLELELFDAEPPGEAQRFWRADHVAPERDPRAGAMPDESELDYVYLPLVLPASLFGEPAADAGLDLVVVADVSAATERSHLELGRSMVESLAAHLGPDDRVAILASDVTLRPLADDGELGPATPERVETLLDALAREPVGGATDLGGALAAAAGLLDPSRQGVVIYVGDGAPTVGDLGAEALLERIARLPHPLRAYAVGVGEEAHLDLLDAVTRGGGLAMRVETRSAAAEGALRILGHARHPVAQRVTVTVDGAEQVFPRTPVDVIRGGVLPVVGRIEGDLPESVRVQGLVAGRPFDQTIAVATAPVDDQGDLRLRWARERLRQLLLGGGQREEIADLGVRYGLITPFTSFYVPSAAELAALGDAARPLYRDLRGRRSAATVPALAPSVGLLGLLGCDHLPDESGGSANVASTPQSQVATETATAEEPEESSVELAPNQDMGEDQRVREQAQAQAAQQRNRFGLRGNDESADAPSPPRPIVAAPAEAEPEPEVAAAADPADPNAAALGRLLGAEGETTGYGGLGLNGQGQSAANGPSGSMALAPATEARERAEEAARAGALAALRQAEAALGDAATGADFEALEAELTEESRRRPMRRRRSRGEADLLDGFGDDAQPRTSSATTRAPSGGSGGGGGDGARDLDNANEPSNTEIDVRVRHGNHRIHVHVDSDPPAQRHAVSRCSDAADLLLDARRDLWRERLQQQSHVSGWVDVFRRARRDCELPRWRDRVALLRLMLGRAGSLPQQVALYRLLDDGGARRWLRRAILGRVRTPADLRLARATFGAAGYDPELLTQVLERAGDGAGRVRVLRQLVRQMPGNLELALMLLEELERQERFAEAKRFARTLREDPLTDAGVRTALGEMYLRLGDEGEARRVFGEIVEFAPQDALARRRLGDLYRAHGWFEEAYLQYRTLASITPDDPSVSLLLAQAAAGAGRVDEALRLEQGIAASMDPSAGAGLGRVAMLWSSVRLAELRKAARDEGDDERLEALKSRMRRSGVTRHAGAFRATLVWSHPEAGLSLWAGHPGLGLTRPTDLHPEYGLEAFDLAEQESGTYRFEVRRAQRGRGEGESLTAVEAKLVFVWNEGKEDERVEVRTLRFEGDSTTEAFAVTGTEVSR